MVGLDAEGMSRPRAVPLAMEMDEAFNRVEMSLLGARALGFDADEVADAIEQKYRRNVSQ